MLEGQMYIAELIVPGSRDPIQYSADTEPCRMTHHVSAITVPVPRVASASKQQIIPAEIEVSP
jgi:hypothetical protein